MAIEQTSISPQFILSGLDANKGTGSFKGQIYYATDTNLNYYWDGNNWIEKSVDLNNVYKLIGNNALNILDLTAQANLTAGINANFIRDTYSDANGYLNTINTTNLKATFNINNYSNYFIETPVLEEMTSANIMGGDWGFVIKPKENIRLIEVLKQTGSTSTKAYLTDNEDNLINSSSFSGDIAIFDDLLIKDHLYKIYVNAEGQTYNSYVTDFVTFPIDSDLVTYTDGIGLNIKIRGVKGLKVIPQPAQFEILKQDLDFIPAKFMIISNEKSVKYDISFDELNYQENLESFTEYSIENQGNSLNLRMKSPNLNAVEVINYNWGVLLW